MRVLGISAFYHDSAAALVSDGDVVAAAQRNASRARSSTKAFRTRPSAIVWKQPEPGCAISTTWCSTISRSSSSSGCWKPILLLRRADLRLRESHAALAQRKAVPEEHAHRRIAQDRPGLRRGAPNVHRAPPRACRQRLLSLAVRRSAGAHRRRRRRMVYDHRGLGRGNRVDILKGSISRTASACFIRPSPPTSAFASIPASTS